MSSSRPSTSESALFTGPTTTYHADTCDRLQQAADRGELRFAALARRGYPGTPFPARMLPEVSSVGHWDARTAQSWGLDWHRNEGIELTYLARGRLTFGVDGQSFELESNTLTITRPWQRHQVGQPHIGPSRLHWVILDVGVRRPNERWRWPSWLVWSAADRERLTRMLRQNEHPVWPASPAVGRCFEHLATLLDRQSPTTPETRLTLLLNELLVEVLDLLHQRQIPLRPELSSVRRTVELFLDSLPRHLDQPWNLDSMARECGLGRTCFARHCEELTNLTPAKYLAHCRLDTAARQLRENPERSITEIAFECGFESSQYFAHAFRREHGLTPTEYRHSRPT